MESKAEFLFVAQLCFWLLSFVPWSKVAILGMVVFPPLIGIGILIMGIKNPTLRLMTIPYYTTRIGQSKRPDAAPLAILAGMGTHVK